MANRNLDDLTIAYLLKKAGETASAALNKAVAAINATIANIQTTLDNKVSKSGDSMTGNLTISYESPGVITNVTGRTDGTAPASDTNSYGFRLRDKNGNNVAIFTDRWNADGRQGAWIAGARSGVYNSLYLFVDSSGNRVVSVSEAAPWRNALNVVNKSGDTMTGALTLNTPLAIASGGTGASSAVDGSFNLQTKPWKNTSAINSTTPRTLSFSGSSGIVYFAFTGGNNTNNMGAYIIYSGGASGTPIFKTVSAASNLTLTAATGKITISSSSSANCYMYLVCMSANAYNNLTLS